MLALVACDKGEGTAAPDGGAAAAIEDADPLDEAATLLVTSLQKGDYEGLHGQTVQPLAHDLSEEEFEDLAAIVSWLGPLKSRAATKTDKSHGGGQRWYELQFEKGSVVELELSLDEGGKLIGFEFSGDGYTEAERGVIAEPWREFKVYGFTYLDAEGQALADGTAIVGNRVDYEIVVGGIEAFIGEHHLSFQKIVLDENGKEVFHEPVEFDIKFAADASGIPRGVVRGYLEVPGPGKWEMDLVIKDEHSHRELDYRQSFETVAAKK